MLFGSSFRELIFHSFELAAHQSFHLVRSATLDLHGFGKLHPRFDGGSAGKETAGRSRPCREQSGRESVARLLEAPHDDSLSRRNFPSIVQVPQSACGIQFEHSITADSVMLASWLSGPALPRVLPFGIYILFLAISGISVNVDSRWLYPVQVGLVAAVLIYLWHRYEELPRLRALHGGNWALAFIVGLIVFILWIRLDAAWMTIGNTGKGFDPRDDDHLNVVLAVSRVLGAALVVPLMEELFWRSFVMRWIDKPAFLAVSPIAVSFRALALSSIVFAVEHHLWFAGLIAGLAYGGLYRVTGNLWVPVIAHAVTNGLLGVWVLYTGSWQFW